MSTTQSNSSRAHRPARPPAPPLPSFDALEETHHQVMLKLGHLAELLGHLKADGVDEPARGLARDICGFFNATARAHHQAEEQFVFPSLLSSGNAELVQHVQRLQQDHGWLEQDWLEIEPQLSAVAEGYSGYDPDFLRAAISVFTELYRDHIALEETIVYPASRGRNA